MVMHKLTRQAPTRVLWLPLAALHLQACAVGWEWASLLELTFPKQQSVPFSSLFAQVMMTMQMSTGATDVTSSTS